MADPYYDEIRKQIRSATSRTQDKDEVIWSTVEAVSAIIDDLADTSLGVVTSIANGIYSALKGKKPLAPNPWFVWNGQDEGSTTYTEKYLRNRGWKQKLGAVFSGAGSVSSQVTQVDVAGIMLHGQAAALSTTHLIQLRSIAANYRQSRTITEWMDLLAKMKALKIGVRGTQLAGAAIPVGAVGMATSIGTTIAKLGIKLTFTKACLATSADIHWRAFQEQAISVGLTGRGGKIGPASRIMYEIFTKRGATRIFGRYDVDRLIREPTGWVGLNDKLMLI